MNSVRDVDLMCMGCFYRDCWDFGMGWFGVYGMRGEWS